jgi:hypothetical protein
MTYLKSNENINDLIIIIKNIGTKLKSHGNPRIKFESSLFF